LGADNDVIEADAVVIGAGPAGLFQVFELGLLGIKSHVVDTLTHPGGQCAELYPDKPIYDIPALPICGAQELVDRLLKQISPFEPQFHLGQEVSELLPREDGRFSVRTALDTRFIAKTVVIAAGLGSFQPKRLGVDGADELENRHVHYRVRNATDFHGKRLVIFGGGDSALDWVLDFCGKAASIVHVHRRPEFRAAPASVARMRELASTGALTYIEGTAAALHALRVALRARDQAQRWSAG
jgi:thioredoxin reductase (NADPH)